MILSSSLLINTNKNLYIKRIDKNQSFFYFIYMFSECLFIPLIWVIVFVGIFGFDKYKNSECQLRSYNFSQLCKLLREHDYVETSHYRDNVADQVINTIFPQMSYVIYKPIIFKHKTQNVYILIYQYYYRIDYCTIIGNRLEYLQTVIKPNFITRKKVNEFIEFRTDEFKDGAKLYQTLYNNHINRVMNSCNE